MNWQEIARVQFDDGELILEFGPILLIVIGLGLVGTLYRFTGWCPRLRRLELVEADLNLGGIGHVKIRPNRDDIQIAHKAWVELATRKAGLPFDAQNDVIVEVYDSWYELFREMRCLAREVPANKIKDSEDTRNTVDLIVNSLNLGLRPHLSRWQARFRRWYQQALEKNLGKDPQDVQRLYPQYDELVADLEQVNKDLIEYMGLLRRLVLQPTH